MTIPWEVLPLDVKAIRSIAVVAYMGTLAADDYAAAMEGGVAPNEAAQGTGRGAVRSISDLIRPEFIRFCGFADEPVESHDEGGSTISFGARDWTGILLDTPVPSKVYRGIQAAGGWDRPVEDLVLEVLATLPAMVGVPLYLVGVEPGSTKATRGATHKAGKKSGKAASRSPRSPGESYWDLLTDLTVMNGFVLFADVWPAPAGMTPACFVLTRPTNIYSDDGDRSYRVFEIGKKGAVDDGTEPSFASKGRAHPSDSGETLRQPTMVLGYNLASLSFKRRLDRVKVPSVELVCLEGKEPLRYRYPEGGGRASQVSPNGLWASEEVRVVPMSGATSVDELKAIAPQIFEAIGRGEMGMDFATQDLASFGGDNDDPDLLDLRAGSPVEVLFAQEAEGEPDGAAVGLRQRLLAMSESELATYLERDRGLSNEAARALAHSLASPQARDLLCRRWYVNEVEHSMEEEGYSCSVHGINYVQARIERDLSKAAGAGGGNG